MPTIEDVKGWHLRETAHMTGGGWFGYIHTFVEQPRISRFDKYTKRDRGVTNTWRLDGQDVANIEVALRGLDTPPIIDLEQRAALAAVPDEFTRWRDLAGAPSYDLLYALRVRGLVEAGMVEGKRGGIRRTDLGREMLK